MGDPCNIVVTIPSKELKNVESEEEKVEKMVSQGEKGWVYWWRISSMPRKKNVKRIYFLWDGAVRAYHEVMYISPCGLNTGGPEVIMLPKIHKINPIPMKPFRGYKYFNVENGK